MNLKFRNFLYGSTQISLEKGFAELFLSECNKAGLRLENIVNNDNVIDFSVQYTDRIKILSIAEKLHMDVVSVTHKGLPYLFFRYRKRMGIPIGLFLSSLIIFILSSCLWTIEISGNDIIPREDIISVLNESTVRTGVFADTVDCSDIEYILYNRFQEISWVSVQVVGSRLFINMKEREKTYEIDEDSEYCNIIASKNGEIIRADVFEGKGKLPPGTPVVKGDLLVSGIVEFKDGRVSFVNSKADIWALTENNIVTSTPYTISAGAVKKYRNNFGISFFNFNFPFNDDTDIESEKSSFFIQKYLYKSGSIVFPVGVLRRFSAETEERQIELQAIQAILISFSDYAKAVIDLEKTADIADKSEKIITGDCIYIEAKINCVENIAEKKYFTVDKTE